MSLSTSAAAFLFKQLYPDGLDSDALVRGNVMMQWCKHETDFTSHKGIDIPVPYSNPQGIGATNAVASANEASSNGEMFRVPQRHVTMIGRIDGDIVRNTIAGGEASQFTDVLEREVDGATESLGQEMNQRIYGQNDGVRSFLHATSGSVAALVATLANPEDAQFYEPNMKITFVNPATGASRGATALTITKVDPMLGTLTVTGNTTLATAGTAAALGDGIVRESMGQGADLDGIKGWCPDQSARTGADSFLGVNRSTYWTRLAGVYVDASALPIRSGLIKANSVARAQVGTKFQKNSPYFINPKNSGQLRQSVEASRVVDSTMADSFGIGIETFDVFGFKFVEDPHCPVDEAILIGKDAFTRGSAGKQPQIDDQDGNQFWYNRSTGKLEFAIAHDGNTYSRKPYNIMRVKLPTVAQ